MKLSLGVKWTLRYALAMMLIVSAVSYVQLRQVERRVREHEVMLLEVQVDEIEEAIKRHPDDRAAIASYVDQHVDSAFQDLKLGIRLLDPEGEILLERGSFEIRNVPLPESLGRVGALRHVSELDLGDAYPYLSMLAPLRTGYVHVIIYGREIARTTHAIRNGFLLSVPIALAATALLGWLLARGSLAPIRDMIETARRISSSQLDERIADSGSGDELDQLAGSLNAMMERIRFGLDRLRSFSANAAHQLRTPVSLLVNRLEVAEAGPRDPEKDQRLIEELLGDAERVGEAIGGMLRLAQTEEGLDPARRRRVELGGLIASVVDFFEPLASERGVALRVHPEARAWVMGDPEWLRELFANLIDNGIRHAPDGGRVDVGIGRQDRAVTVRVRDSGAGIAPEDLPRVFDRFHRGRGSEPSKGAGLGLALAREICEAHDGRIAVESEPGRGASFTVRLPAAPREASD